MLERLDSDLTNAQLAEELGVSVFSIRSRRKLRVRKPTALDPVGDSPPPPAVDRVIYAQSRVYNTPFAELVADLMTQFGIARTAACSDIRAAREQLMADAAAERPAIRAMATLQFKEIANLARQARQYTAAVAAWREIARLHGAYEPDKITIVPSDALELGAIIGVLSPSGKAALDVLLEDIERARAAGQLPPREPEPVDAEIIGDGQLELGDGNGN